MACHSQSKHSVRKNVRNKSNFPALREKVLHFSIDLIVAGKWYCSESMTYLMYKCTLSRQHVQDAGCRSSALAACGCVSVLCFWACVCLSCVVVALEWNAPWVADGGISRCWIQLILHWLAWNREREVNEPFLRQQRGCCLSCHPDMMNESLGVHAPCCTTEKCSTFAQETHWGFTRNTVRCFS